MAHRGPREIKIIQPKSPKQQNDPTKQNKTKNNATTNIDATVGKICKLTTQYITDGSPEIMCFCD